MRRGGTPDLSVLTVTFNSAGHVAAALDSARAAAGAQGLSLELVAVDNGSGDGSIDVVRRSQPEAVVIANAENVGFGRANNQAFEVATGRRWLLLNPDAVLDAGALGELMAAIDRLEAGAVAPTIGDSGAESAGMAPGIRSAAGHFLFLNRLLPPDAGGAFRGLQLRRSTSDEARRVEWASAAVLMLDPAAVRAVGGFDPRFFLYGEDVDLGLRLTRAGHPVWLVPTARARHLIAASQGGVSVRWVDALHDLYREVSGPVRLALFDLVLALGLSIRAAAAGLPGGSKTDRAVHARRMRAAARRAWTLLAGGR